jgi:hypothetical protein
MTDIYMDPASYDAGADYHSDPGVDDASSYEEPAITVDTTSYDDTSSGDPGSSDPQAPADLPPVPADLPPVPADLPPVPADLPPAPADLPPAPADLPPAENPPPILADPPPVVEQSPLQSPIPAFDPSGEQVATHDAAAGHWAPNEAPADPAQTSVMPVTPDITTINVGGPGVTPTPAPEISTITLGGPSPWTADLESGGQPDLLSAAWWALAHPAGSAGPAVIPLDTHVFDNVLGGSGTIGDITPPGTTPVYDTQSGMTYAQLPGYTTNVGGYN